MSGNEGFLAMLFDSVSHAMMAEKLLKSSGIDHKMIPVPRHISSDCGVCLRISPIDEAAASSLLNGKVNIAGICAL